MDYIKRSTSFVVAVLVRYQNISTEGIHSLWNNGYAQKDTLWRGTAYGDTCCGMSRCQRYRNGLVNSYFIRKRYIIFCSNTLSYNRFRLRPRAVITLQQLRGVFYNLSAYYWVLTISFWQICVCLVLFHKSKYGLQWKYTWWKTPHLNSRRSYFSNTKRWVVIRWHNDQ